MISSLFSPGLFYTAVASTDNDDNNDEDFEDFEDGNIIQICCAWGVDLQDGKLTYHIDASSKDTAERSQQGNRGMGFKDRISGS